MKMLISLHELVKKYQMNIRGILHIGAHECEELEDYLQYVPKYKIIWVEANPELVKNNLLKDPELQIYQAIITDREDEEIALNITNNGQSSSIFEFGQHEIDYPWCRFVDKYNGKSMTIEKLYCDNNIPKYFANFLNIDIQGAELLALKGMHDILHHFDFLYLEINQVEMYKNCALVTEIDTYLIGYGFERIETYMVGGWGDALYIRKARRPFGRYLGDRILVESGTYIGDGIADALKCGFEKVISYELVHQFHKQAVEKYGNNPNVSLYLRSSLTMMNEIKHIDKQITFWLDGHYSGGDTQYDGKFCPLLEELAIISQHPRKDHIILIDDIRLCGTSDFSNVTLDQIKAAILYINPSYKFSYDDGYEKNDVLVARVNL